MMMTTTKKTIRGTTGGFTLVELIVCMIILAAGTTGIMSVFYNTGRGAIFMDRAVRASNLAREKLEMVIGDKFSMGYVALEAIDYPDETFPAPYRDFTRTTAITEVDPSDFVTERTGSGYKRVTVTVTWGGGTSERVSIPVILTDY